jgi:hypothetical protein
LEGQGTFAVTRVSRQLIRCILDNPSDIARALTGWLSICDGDDQDWFSESAVARVLEDQWAQNFVLKFSSHGSQAREACAGDHFSDLLLAADAVTLIGGVHEANLNAVFVEERGGVSDS